jgi:hypothetical protein
MASGFDQVVMLFFELQNSVDSIWVPLPEWQANTEQAQPATNI